MSSKKAAILSITALVGFGLTACSDPAPSIKTTTDTCEQTTVSIGEFVEVPSGSFLKGADPLYPEERPSIRLQVERFWIQSHEVTNAQFATFVEATGYVTDAERGIEEERVGAGSAVFLHPREGTLEVPGWQLNGAATWQTPEGAGSSVETRSREPVVHVSKRDAAAFASWAGGRLPSEMEWEYAASLGLPDPAVSTSGAYDANGPRANTWQGIFPVSDTGKDGFEGPAPIGCYGKDRLGLHDMIGNVWEWTDTPYQNGFHTIKGGSFLCADNFCRRYRPAARQPQETDFSSNHIGFRIVRDTPPSMATETPATDS